MDQGGLISASWELLISVVLAVARPMGFLSVNPIWSRLGLTGLLKGTVAMAVAIPAVPYVLTHTNGVPLTGASLLLIAAKEGTLGLVLGFMSGVPVWSAQFAGDLLDQQRGATSGRLTDPAGFEDVSISGTLLVLAATALFVSNGGLPVLAGLLYASWTIWPILSPLPAPTDQAPILVLGVLQAVTEQGLLLAVPLVIAMLFSDVAVTLVARFAPQLRVEDASAAARNLVFCVGLLLYLGYLVRYLGQGMAIAPGWLAGLAIGFR